MTVGAGRRVIEETSGLGREESEERPSAGARQPFPRRSSCRSHGARRSCSRVRNDGRSQPTLHELRRKGQPR